MNQIVLKTCILLLVLIFFYQPIYTVHAQSNDSNYLSVEVLWQLKRIGNPIISPNGEWVIAPVTHYTLSDDKSHTDLWLFKTDGTVERPLTRHGSADGQPVFSPNGDKLAFVSRRDDDSAAQVYILPINEPGEGIRLTNVPTGVTGIDWVGKHIYFVSNVWPGKTWEEMKEQMDADRASHVSAHQWNALPYSSWDRWIAEERQAHLYRIPSKGGDIQPITLPTGWELSRSGASVANYSVSPDESLIAFTSDSNRNDLEPSMDIFLVEPGNSEARNITPDNVAPNMNPSFSPDGLTLAYTSQRIVGFYADRTRLSLYDVSNNTHRIVADNWDRSIGGMVWKPQSDGFFAPIDDAGTRRIYHISLDGEIRGITSDTDFPSVDISNNGKLVALNHSFLHPPQVVTVNPENGEVTRLDTINDDVMDGVELGTYESVTYEGADGQEIQMWVHYPPGFDSSKQYPLFLLIHGGPHSGISDGFHFRWNAQTFASWGYVTAWHNFHGSSGFGQDFTDAINPDWITKPYEDTMKAAEWFANQSWIDADRMVAGGGSYGGYLSSILLAKDHPFNALLIHAPVYNMYSQMAADFAVHTARFGNYWENDIYKEISPHYFAEDFKTPALIIHGQLDYRVPVGQAFELFRTLQSRDVDSRLIYYPDENHWILKPNNSIYWYNEVQRWFEIYAESGGR